MFSHARQVQAVVIIASALLAMPSFAHPWDEFAGCYQTVAVEGKPVDTLESWPNESEVNDGWHANLFDAEKKPVSAMNFSMYEKTESGYSVWSYFGVIPSGEFTDNGNSFSYKMDGEFHIFKQGDKTFHVHDSATLTKTGDQTISIHFVTKIDENSNYDSDKTFSLKRVQCD